MDEIYYITLIGRTINMQIFNYGIYVNHLENQGIDGPVAGNNLGLRCKNAKWEKVR
jgi:hypothetical protein